MEKIHNNLNIENLIKTEWFNQFNKNQKRQILLGLKNNLDVSIYANPELLWGEMEYFRLNLLEKNALELIFSSEICEINKEKRNEQNI